MQIKIIILLNICSRINESKSIKNGTCSTLFIVINVIKMRRNKKTRATFQLHDEKLNFCYDKVTKSKFNSKMVCIPLGWKKRMHFCIFKDMVNGMPNFIRWKCSETFTSSLHSNRFMHSHVAHAKQNNPLVYLANLEQQKNNNMRKWNYNYVWNVNW